MHALQIVADYEALLGLNALQHQTDELFQKGPMRVLSPKVGWSFPTRWQTVVEIAIYLTGVNNC